MKRNATKNINNKKSKMKLIKIYKLMNNLEETDRKDEIMKKIIKARYLRHTRKIAKRNLFDTKKYIFPKADTWNGLKEEVIMAKKIHQLKEKTGQT